MENTKKTLSNDKGERRELYPEDSGSSLPLIHFKCVAILLAPQFIPFFFVCVCVCVFGGGVGVYVVGGCECGDQICNILWNINSVDFFCIMNFKKMLETCVLLFCFELSYSL